MVTAWDIDGCLIDFTGQVLVPIANGLFDKGIPEDHIQTQWNFSNLLEPEEEAAIWSSQLLIAYMRAASPIQEALDLIRETPSSFFITSRGTMGSQQHNHAARSATTGCLSKMGLGDRAVYFSRPMEKLAIAQSHGAEEVWEDHPETVLDYAEAGLRVHMPVYPYNTMTRHPNIIRHEGWGR